MRPGSEYVTGGLGSVIGSFDHVSIAVHDIAGALPMMEMLQASYLNGGDVARSGFRWMQFRLPGDAKVELVQPLDSEDESHFLVRFLTERGEGVHHLTFRVEDLLETVEAVRGRGFTVVGLNTDHDWKEAFIHPHSAHGVLIQIAQWTREAPPAALQDVLDGNVTTGD